MDSKETDNDYIELDLSNISLSDDQLTIMDSAGAQPVFSFASGMPASTITIGGNGGASGAYITNTLSGLEFDPWTNSTSGKLKLQGEDADIDINGVSLCSTLKDIQERLNMLTPNPELEGEWSELRALGDQYRELEQKIKDKMKTWQALNQR